MKAIKVLLFAAGVLVFHINELAAQAFIVKTFNVSVKGSSSLHDWESSVDKFESKGSFILTNNSLAEIKDVFVKIPVKSIKSTKGKMMDNKTYEAFNVEKNPFITFVLLNKKIIPTNNALNVSGTLTMAGVSKPIELSLVYKILPGGDLQVTGSKKLLMSEFRMEPPTAMMGTIKVGDQIEVVIDLVLSLDNTTL